MGGEVRVGRGPRAVESLLLEAVGELAEKAPDPGELGRPLRIVVPSRSLRDHVAARLVAHLGRALLGARIQTLYGVAAEIGERAGDAPARGEPLLPILVRRAAAAEPALRETLDGLRDGYAPVVAAVADLLDAGLGEEHAAALRAAFRSRGSSRHESERALATLETGLRVRRQLDAAGLARRSELFTRAAASLERAGPRALPSRAVLIHGFAEATGRASALIEALVRTCDARLFLDHPPDPLDPRRESPAAAFTARLRDRLLRPGEERGAAAVLTPASATTQCGEPGRPQLRLVRAPGPHADVRAAAYSIRALLDGGERPEGIGVVVRSFTPAYALAVRRHFGRLGIPFSDAGEHGPPPAEARRLQALVDLVSRGGETPVDRWLDALGWIPELGSRRAPEPRRNPLRRDLSLGLHALGAGRLRDVAELDLAARLGATRSLALPVRRGTGEDDAEGAARTERRHLGRGELETAVGHARALLGREPRRARASEQLAGLGELAAALGWCERVPGWERLRAALHRIETHVPPQLELDGADLALLLQRAVAEACSTPLGGAGGGVQVLDVTEARARTFEHLFALGLSRDVFPRGIREDVLLPDRVREAARAVLPEMPLKRAGHVEEAYLFGQLLASSPRVTLSWPTQSDDGDPRPASSFVDRHRIAYPDLPVTDAPAALAVVPTGAPRPPDEHAVLAGLHGTREGFGAALRAALRAGRSDGARADALARARLEILAEQDPGRRRSRELGPYFGFVGATRARGDPRNGPLFVTSLERMSLCPWQTFLTRVLRLEAPPDALEGLPALDPRSVGNAVHAALERIAARGGAPCRGRLEEAARSSPVVVAWPPDLELDALVAAAARRVLLDDGVALPGMSRALAESARPRLEAARELLWPEGKLEVLGAELDGELELAAPGGGLRRLGFKVDLAERAGPQLRLTDYKTGAARWDAVRPQTRRARFLRAVERGGSLQAVAYALAAPGAEGRYVYLRPELEPERSLYSVPPAGDAGGDALRAAFGESARALLAAWDAGAFFPRLAYGDGTREPRMCERCPVAEACLRGDAGARARLLESAATPHDRVSDATDALADAWPLGPGA